MLNNVSEKDFHMLAEVIPQLVWIVTPDGKFLYCNKKLMEYLDVTSSEEDAFAVWLDSLHPDDKDHTMKVWAAAVKSGSPYETEYRMRNGKTGEYRWFLARAAVMKESPTDVRWFGTCTDIQEQKILSDGQEFLAKSSKILASSIHYLDTIQKVTELAIPRIADWCTIELVENNELKQVAVAHKNPQELKNAKELARHRKRDLSSQRVVPHILKTGESAYFPIVTVEMLTTYAKDSKEFALFKKLNIESSMFVPITIDQKTIGVIQFVSTESKKRFSKFDLYVAEEIGRRVALTIQNAQLVEEAQRKEKQFRALYNSNIIGVIYTNASGLIYDANEAFLDMVGFTKKDMKAGKIRWDELTPPKYKSKMEEVMKEMLTNGFVNPWEKEYYTKDGSIVPAIICSVVLNKKTTDSLTLVLDITERKRLEERKDEFIGITSHELKTPLTSIKGYVQILERIINEMGDEQMTTYIKKTNTYINRLNSLIVDLLDVSKVQAGKLLLNYSTFDFQELIQQSIDAVQGTSGSHKISVNTLPTFEWRGDEHRLEQVLINLLTNAVKYSPRSSKVLIHLTKNEHEVVLGIQDFGIGISKKELSKIFERFYRVESVSKRFSGLGIGLYISYEIVKRHGGRMWVESELGKGSTFYFSLPDNQISL